jgi:hypothetical protein
MRRGVVLEPAMADDLRVSVSGMAVLGNLTHL